jgi:hypothetical protein
MRINHMDFSFVLEVWNHVPIILGGRGYLFMFFLVNERCTHKWVFFQKEPFDWTIVNILGTRSTPQYKSLNMSPSPNKSMFCHALLWPTPPSTPPFPPFPYNLYTWKLNHDPTIQDKKWNIIGNVLGNTLGGEKKQKKFLSHPPHPPEFKRKKLSPLWTFSLSTWNFYLQNNLSPFST